ncbi:MAG: SOS response-associated peptidase, partial [Robiginitomaculum sp.]
PMFNARLETAADKPSFRTPWRRRRALIPFTGWYEWEGVERPKQPYYIREKDSPISAFAGLWDQYHVDEGITLLSATILTTAVIGPMKHVHHRMPVRLPQSEWQNWLEPDARPEKTITHMLASEDLIFERVSTAVNSGRAGGAELIIPLGDE